MSKGIGANLLKIDSKKRRTKREIEEAKAAELDRENVMRAKQAQIDQLHHQVK